jgi:CubicO group peptidase (beta-lactamase class C family)
LYYRSAEAAVLGRVLEEAFQAGQLSGLHGILVIHKGETVVEKYFPGEDLRWRKPLGIRHPDAHSLHDLLSITKSIIGLLYGIALSDGVVPNLDDKLVTQFPEYPDIASDPKRQKIFIRHALSMKMGIKWDEELPYSDPGNGEAAMEAAADRYRYVLDRPLLNEQGEQWTYNGGATAIVAGLIAKGTRIPIDVYAKEKLFAPLGIEDFEWKIGQDGVPLAASGLRTNIHDLAKIGRLIINNGAWYGRHTYVFYCSLLCI